MSKCRRCGNQMYENRKICSSCLRKWCDMRTEVFNALQEQYGGVINLPIFQKEIRRLGNLYNKDAEKYSIELLKIKTQ